MKKILIYTLPLLLLFSCIGKKEGGSEATETAEANIIKITSEQFKTSGMQLGELS